MGWRRYFKNIFRVSFCFSTFIWLKLNHRVKIYPVCRHAELKVLGTQYLLGLIKLWSWI